MSLSALVSALEGVPGLALRAQEPMSRHTDLRVGGPADLWVVAESKDALEAVAREGKSQGVKLHFFQETHVLVRDGGLDGGGGEAHFPQTGVGDEREGVARGDDPVVGDESGERDGADWNR